MRGESCGSVEMGEGGEGMGGEERSEWKEEERVYTSFYFIR